MSNNSKSSQDDNLILGASIEIENLMKKIIFKMKKGQG